MSCFRQERDGLLIGPYESGESMVQMEDWARQGVPRDFGKVHSTSSSLLHPPAGAVPRGPGPAGPTPGGGHGRLPLLPGGRDPGTPPPACHPTSLLQSVVNGPITYTPDLLPMVGPSQLPNMWMAVGFGYGIGEPRGGGGSCNDCTQCTVAVWASTSQTGSVTARLHTSS